QTAVLELDDLPAGGGEHPLQLVGGDVGHDPVQRLAVEVDDPYELAQLGDIGVEHGLPHGALVQLDVPDQRVLPPGSGAPEGDVDVASGHRDPDRRGRTGADRSGGVVDGIGVSDAARITLQTAELTQPRQVRL